MELKAAREWGVDLSQSFRRLFFLDFNCDSTHSLSSSLSPFNAASTLTLVFAFGIAIHLTNFTRRQFCHRSFEA